MKLAFFQGSNMKITDIIGNTLARAEDSAKSSKSNKTSAAGSYFGDIAGDKQAFGEDTVTISPVSRQLAQISKIIADDKTDRAEKIELLKQKIINGEYNISSEEVAKVLLNYIDQKEAV